MSNSSDSLKKKVCVTVSLDELFEEVLDDDGSRDLKQPDGSETTEVTTEEKQLKPVPVIEVGNEEKILENEEKSQSRPRKHRRESKFSKNHVDSFKNELTKYGYNPKSKIETDGYGRESGGSESDFDLDEFLEKDKWALENSRSSLTDFDMTEESFLSVNPVASSMKVCYRSKPNLNLSNCNKSTQFNGEDRLVKIDECVPEEKTLALSKTQKQIHLILAKAKSRHTEKEDRVRHYDLRSILEECVKTEENSLAKSKSFPESDGYDLSDSYTRVFPHKKDGGNEVKRVWASARRINGFDSELSEADSTHKPLRHDAVVCYTLRLKRTESSEIVHSETTSRESSFESLKSKGSLENNSTYRAVLRLGSSEALKGIGITNDGILTTKSLPEGRNFAEGDTFKKPLSLEAYISDTQEKTKEKIFLGDEILKPVVESINTEIVVNRAEIELNSSEPKPPTEELAEVLFKKNQIENFEKNMLDAESEMVFAERENEDFLGSGGLSPAVTIRPSSQSNDICILEFEDKLSQSKILRRMKTVEILGDSSLSDMKNISTEVILICENISNNEVCLEAWQSSGSTLKSLTEMGQCYLKDAKDSAMYLIEIPLHFIRAEQKKPSDSDQVSKTSDSD